MFNRAKLMNIGFIEALRDGFDCFVFHDVDMILADDRCPYTCLSQPIHYANNVDKHQGLLYPTYFGEFTF